MRKSPDRGSFQREGYMKRVESGETKVEDAEGMFALFKTMDEQRAELESSEEWRKDNLEYDLRSSDWIAKKCDNTVYAQNLYAAMCNNDFMRNDVWPVLQGKTWSCSWRSAGGIVANIQQKGDYIDWYCSGIRNNEDMDDESYNQLTKEQQEYYVQQKLFVSESVVTDEIREDLLKLGWIVIDNNEDTML